jgi:glycosyltransferase involved in cell wall biosynthesis
MTTPRIPFCVVGDGPTEPTGLGRIARELCAHIVQSDLPLDLLQIGGPISPFRDWPVVPMPEEVRAADWGCRFVYEMWWQKWGATPGILFLIWDPGRVAAYSAFQAPVQKWAYTALDAPNRIDSIGGPAGAALAQCDRVLAYGRWASTVIKMVRADSVPYLPHGLFVAPYAPETTVEEQAWVRVQLGPHVGSESLVVGCVATNQPRKDLGLFFQTLSELVARNHKVYAWLHTDVMVKAWSVLQLVDDCGLAKRVSVTTGELTDRQLALLYQRCDVTIAPGLGEGFGYPIVESLAAGTPVVHGDFGGGRELVPKIEWRFPVRELRLEGVYAQHRPVFRPSDVANAIERVLSWRAQVGPAVVDAYCRGSVAHLDWTALWPRWRSWLAKGLTG